ncbi:MAG TPA: DUF1028 domain-containing protein [Ilumatobacteraceae bacterium]|nr:DUF1028 domain-containing protein [Ilumatobacteraceae bacterium]
MTYSVVLRDSATGALGVAVQSHWFNVASVVPWVEAGVGAIAMQSVADPMYGPRGLALMRDGVGATDALERLLAADESSHLRQVAIVDSTGSVAAHTGSGCIPHASHVTGDGWSVQGNIMRNDRVVPAMAAAAEASRGSVSDRLFAILTAAEAAGGDLRGSQSAAMLVSGDGPVPAVRLSVEDHADPIGEFGRLLEIRQMYDDMEAGDEALADADPSRAAAAYERAARSPHAHNEVVFWRAHGLATVGRYDEAAAIMRPLVVANPDMSDLLGRIAAVGLIDPAAHDGLRAALDER